MAWHDLLMDRLEKQVEQNGNPGRPPSEEWLMVGSGTANYRAMAWAAEYLRVTRHPAELPAWVEPGQAKEYVESWRQRALDFFAEQKQRGFMCLGEADEQLACDPHMNFWLYAVATFRLAAGEARHQDVLAATTAWYRDLFALFALGATPDGNVFLPGARTKGASPNHELATMIHREVHGLAQQGKHRKPELWDQRYYRGAQAVRRFLEAGDDLGKPGKVKPQAAAKVNLRHRTTVERYPTGMRAWCDYSKPPKGLAAQFATFVEVRYGKGSKPTVVEVLKNEPVSPPHRDDVTSTIRTA